MVNYITFTINEGQGHCRPEIQETLILTKLGLEFEAPICIQKMFQYRPVYT